MAIPGSYFFQGETASIIANLPGNVHVNFGSLWLSLDGRINVRFVLHRLQHNQVWGQYFAEFNEFWPVKTNNVRRLFTPNL